MSLLDAFIRFNEAFMKEGVPPPHEIKVDKNTFWRLLGESEITAFLVQKWDKTPTLKIYGTKIICQKQLN